MAINLVVHLIVVGDIPSPKRNEEKCISIVNNLYLTVSFGAILMPKSIVDLIDYLCKYLL